MSNPQAASQPIPIDPKIGLAFRASDLLIPLFLSSTIDAQLAMRMALSAIEAYRPETRADYVNVARTIAFSMAALALLGRAASDEFTLAEKMRAFGRANALNRSADQSERTMMQRRRYQLANPPAQRPDAVPKVRRTEAPKPKAQPAPEAPIDDSELQASIAEAMKEYLANCAAARTAPTPAQPASGISPVPPVSPLPPAAASPKTAIHYTSPTPASPAASIRSALMGQSALHSLNTPQPGTTARPQPTSAASLAK